MLGEDPLGLQVPGVYKIHEGERGSLNIDIGVSNGFLLFSGTGVCGGRGELQLLSMVHRQNTL